MDFPQLLPLERRGADNVGRLDEEKKYIFVDRVTCNDLLVGKILTGAKDS